MGNDLRKKTYQHMLLWIPATLSIIVSTIILVGWQIGDQKLVSLFLPPPLVSASTALSFLFIGLSLIFIACSMRWLSIFSSIIVLILSLLPHIKHLFSNSLSINTTIYFFLLGICLMLTAKPYKYRISILVELLSAILFLLTSLLLFQYSMQNFQLTTGSESIGIPIYTLLGLNGIGICLFLYHSAFGENEPKFFLAPIIGLSALISCTAAIFIEIFYHQGPALQNLTKSNPNSLVLFFLLIIGFIPYTLAMTTLMSVIYKARRIKKALIISLNEKDTYSAYQKAILNSSNYIIISTDINGKINSFNHTAENLLQWSADEIIGKKFLDFFHSKKELKARAEKLSERLNKQIPPDFHVFITTAIEGVADELEWTYIRKDGSTFSVQLSVTPVKNSKGTILGFVGIAYDLTKISEINELKTKIMGFTSHEIRSPLTAIKGALDLIFNRESLSSEGKSLIEISQRNCERLMRLSTDIIDTQKIESGKMEFHYNKLSINDLLLKAYELNLSLVTLKHLRFQKPENIPNKNILGDEDRLIQVLTNFISNAIKHSPPNSLVSFVVSEHNQKIRIGIKDEGGGISKDFYPHIFEKFSQSSLDSLDPKRGTGLGLYISKSIIESHKGSIGVDSTPEGSLFWFELPIVST